jgi:hypothetical protein
MDKVNNKVGARPKLHWVHIFCIKVEHIGVKIYCLHEVKIINAKVVIIRAC